VVDSNGVEIRYSLRPMT